MMTGFISHIFDIFNKEEISYVVLRNYWELPDLKNGEDIDIFIDKKSLNRVIDMLKKLGFAIFLTKTPHRHLQCFYYDKNFFQFIAIDFIWELRFGQLYSFPFLKEGILQERIQYKNFSIPSPEIEYLILILHLLLDKRCIPEKYQKEGLFNHFLKKINQDTLEKIALESGVSETIDRSIKLLKENKRNEFINLNKVFFKEYFSKSTNNKSEIIKKRFSLKIHSLFKRYFVLRKGLRIALIGPDGSGKTTVYKELVKNFSFPFKGIYMGGLTSFIYNTLMIIKKIKKKAIEEEISCEKNIINEKTPSGIKLFILSINILFSLLWRANIKSSFYYRRAYIVIFDRYYKDYLIVFKEGWFKRLFSKVLFCMFPQLDFVFHLVAAPSVIYERKPELDLKSIEFFQKELRKLFGSHENYFEIKTDRKPKEAAGEIISYIWKPYLYSRLSKTHIYIENLNIKEALQLG